MFDRGFVFDIYTLVDITATGVTRDSSENKQRNQQRNWESILQTVSLRTQPFEIHTPTTFTANLSESPIFGQWFMESNQTVWHTQIYVENEEIFKKGDDSFGLLKEDFFRVPIINGLDETAKFILPMFCPYGELTNIIFN